MNTSDNKALDQAALDEREWQAQEQALRDERLGIAASGSDAPQAHYRAIARALLEPLEPVLPPDFARQVASKATASAAPARANARFEQIMLGVLGATLVVSGVVAMVRYGGEALPTFDARIAQWGLAIAVCAGLSWSLDWLRRIRRHDGNPLRPV